MKKKFTIGLIALLSVSFIFFGCGGDSGSSSSPTAAEIAAGELATELLGTDFNFTGVTVTSGTAEVVLGEGGNIPAGQTLSVPEGVTLVLPADQTLTVPANGEIVVNGALTIAGSAALTGVAGATIEVGTDVIVTGGDFYPDDSETAGNAVSGTIYKWEADAGGSGTDGWKAQVPAPSATVANVTIAGTNGVEFDEPFDVVITILNDTLVAKIDEDTDLASWITNLPADLTAVAKADADAGTASVTIVVDGTPGEALSAALEIVIPASVLTTTGAQTLNVTTNNDAKFAIEES
jgi:hypothetical protein